MTTLYFKCTFCTDVVLNATSATAGAIETLQYIPGAKFLGIVARRYKDYADPLTLFHSGKVRFGDAHLADEYGNRSIKAPFVFSESKTANENYKNKAWLEYLLSEEDKKKLKDDAIQPKQLRNCFYTTTAEHKNKKQRFQQVYSLKSAYDADKRRNKDQQIFGYNALAKGSVWLFSVELEEDAAEAYTEQIISALVGRHSLGKSRSAQYGRIKIEQIEAFNQTTTTIPAPLPHHITLYAESDWCFIDECGEYTLMPCVEKHLNLKQGQAEIDWSESRIRHRIYAPWNAKRSARDADRWVIEKGSVLVIKYTATEPLDASHFEKGIGSFRSEGLGKVLFNPAFLADKCFKFEEDEKADSLASIAEKIALQDHLQGKTLLIAELIAQRQAAADPRSAIAGAVFRFIGCTKKTFETITASQWGQIRNIAQNAKGHWELLLFHDTIGFLRTAQRKNNWPKTAVEKLELFAKEAPKGESYLYLVALASEMAKIARQ